MKRSTVFLIGWALGVLTNGLGWWYLQQHKLADAMQTVNAYDSCMKHAGHFNCHMTPENFIEYYDAKLTIKLAEQKDIDHAQD